MHHQYVKKAVMHLKHEKALHHVGRTDAGDGTLQKSLPQFLPDVLPAGQDVLIEEGDIQIQLIQQDIEHGENDASHRGPQDQNLPQHSF